MNQALKPALELDVHRAIASVDDPEYPGISIVDLGLLESVELTNGEVVVGLIPTFSGCPALAVIADDVRTAIHNQTSVRDVRVEWLTTPVWELARVSDDARHQLAQEFNVAVQLGRRDPTARCPRCGADTIEQSMFGPSRCRSVHRCSSCNETVEVLRN